MKAKVIINNLESEIALIANETILDSCLRAQLAPPYSCLEGVCSICEAKILAGEVKVLSGFENEADPKIVKTCQTFPTSSALVVKFLPKAR